MDVQALLSQFKAAPLALPASYRTASGHEKAWTRFALGESQEQFADAMQPGTFKGMASVFNTLIDAYVPTRIFAGAFNKTLVDNASRIKVLYQHSDYAPIGKPTMLRETQNGLYIEGAISRTSLGNDVITLLKDGVITEMSIGFEPLRWEMVATGEGNDQVERHITEIQLWEVSLVTFAANRDAKIMSVHSLAAAMDEQAHGRSMVAVPGGVPGMGPIESLTSATTALVEQHAGKVLSAKNRTLVVNAVAALRALLAAADTKQAQGLTPIERMDALQDAVAGLISMPSPVDTGEEAAELVSYHTLDVLLGQIEAALAPARAIVADLISAETDDATETPDEEAAEETVEAAQIEAVQALCTHICSTTEAVIELTATMLAEDAPEGMSGAPVTETQVADPAKVAVRAARNHALRTLHLNDLARQLT